MGLSPLHKLAQMISAGEYIEDSDLLGVLGQDGTIVVPLKGGGERHLPSGEILSVLADSAQLSVQQVLARNFRMSPVEVETALSFMSLVQFVDEGRDDHKPAPEQPLQPLDS